MEEGIVGKEGKKSPFSQNYLTFVAGILVGFLCAGIIAYIGYVRPYKQAVAKSQELMKTEIAKYAQQAADYHAKWQALRVDLVNEEGLRKLAEEKLRGAGEQLEEWRKGFHKLRAQSINNAKGCAEMNVLWAERYAALAKHYVYLGKQCEAAGVAVAWELDLPGFEEPRERPRRKGTVTVTE
jgi:hypothetical protein